MGRAESKLLCKIFDRVSHKRQLTKQTKMSLS